jgi:hypothetical protein
VRKARVPPQNLFCRCESRTVFTRLDHGDQKMHAKGTWIHRNNHLNGSSHPRWLSRRMASINRIGEGTSVKRNSFPCLPSDLRSLPQGGGNLVSSSVTRDNPKKKVVVHVVLKPRRRQYTVGGKGVSGEGVGWDRMRAGDRGENFKLFKLLVIFSYYWSYSCDYEHGVG